MELLHKGRTKQIYKYKSPDEILSNICSFWKFGTMESLKRAAHRIESENLIEDYAKLPNILGVEL